MRTRRRGLMLAACPLLLAACSSGSTGVLNGPAPSPLVTPSSPAASSARAIATATTTARHSVRATATATRAAATPTAVRTTSVSTPTATHHATATPAPTRTAPTACPNTSAKTSLAMVNSGAAYAFSPSTVSVTCGGILALSNNSTAPHNVTPSSGGFTASSDVAPTGTGSVRMSYRGTYSFFCSIHSYMTGKVTVT